MNAPCDPWVEAADIADCCGLTLGSQNTDALTAAAENASAILYQLSGSRYTGTCTRTVRPVDREICWWWTPTARAGFPGFPGFPRHRLSRVKLAGYVTAITEVLIDGDVLDASLYRIDEHRFLTRLADPDGTPRAWPQFPRLDLPASEQGTFQISYEHGEQPPGAGAAAASALACELYKACPAAGDTGGECKLPAGVKRIVRQGVTVETISAVATMLRKGATGLVQVDAFLAAYGRGRPPAIWSPDIARFARPEGITSGS
jgi:hypothetical protein